MNELRNDRGESETASPLVIDLGKQRRKRVRDLRKGKPGPLLDDVREAIATLRAQGAVAKDAQPIIVVVSEKRPKGNLFRL